MDLFIFDGLIEVIPGLQRGNPHHLVEVTYRSEKSTFLAGARSATTIGFKRPESKSIQTLTERGRRYTFEIDVSRGVTGASLSTQPTIAILRALDPISLEVRAHGRLFAGEPSSWPDPQVLRLEAGMFLRIEVDPISKALLDIKVMADPRALRFDRIFDA